MSHTTAAQPAKGTVLSYATTQAGTYAPVALRTSLGGPEPEKEKVDCTHFDSAFIAYRDSALPDLGEITLNIWWDPGDTLHQTLETWATGASPNVWWHIVYQDAKGTTAEFQGFLKSFKKSEIDPKSNLAATVVIVPTSVPTYTYANPTS